MSEKLGTPLSKDCLVLYKSQAARVSTLGEKIEIWLQDGQTKLVRPKDVVFLHPGPITDLNQLTDLQGEAETAWELLAGEPTSLEEIAELAFNSSSPSAIWAARNLVMEGDFFYETPEHIMARTQEELDQHRTMRAAKASQAQAWQSLLQRVKDNCLLDEDRLQLVDLESVALGKSEDCRLLRALNQSVTREHAHQLLLKLGVWVETTNPYPARFDQPLDSPILHLGEISFESRMDLTNYPAFAIDDEGNTDPDDAISFINARLWVHIADVAALVLPDSPADLEARGRGANLYLPDRTITMLPTEATQILGLGLSERSPALSFELELNAEGQVVICQIQRTWVKVDRLTYQAAEPLLEQSPFQSMLKVTQQFRRQRIERGAIMIELPEVRFEVQAGRVFLRPLPRLKSREMVTDSMLMVGEAVARFAFQNDIPFPYAVQDSTGTDRPEIQNLSEMFAFRKKMKPSQLTAVARPHAGLGLEVYSRATSPLRRYLDLVVHQQLRAFTKGQPTMSSQDIMTRIGATQAVTGKLRKAERFSNAHWTLVFLIQNPNWQGKGILVEHRGPRAVVLIPDLGLETQLQMSGAVALNTEINLACVRVDLVNLSTQFKIV